MQITFHLVWWNSFWAEQKQQLLQQQQQQQQQHYYYYYYYYYPSNQCCPLSSILLWILYSELTNCTNIQNISQYVLFKSEWVCPSVWPESLS